MLTLPVCAVVCLVLWWFPTEGFSMSRVWSALLVAFITYVLMEVNNTYMLMRIRSRMVSSTWLIGVAAIATLHGYSPALVATACCATAYYLVFATYQKQRCPNATFHYAAALSLGSIFLPQMAAFLPLYLWHQLAFLRCMSLRTFCAALIGYGFPLALWGAKCFLQGDFGTIEAWVSDLIAWQPIQLSAYTNLSLQQLASWGLVTLLGLLGAIHYLSTSYNDRIQVRMLLYIFVVQFVAVEVYVGLQPHRLDTLMPLLLLNAVPLIAHFFALTRSWFTNALFVLSALSFIALAYLHLAIPTISPWMHL